MISRSLSLNITDMKLKVHSKIASQMNPKTIKSFLVDDIKPREGEDYWNCI